MMIQTADIEGATDRSSALKTRMAKYTRQLKEINAVTLEFQRRGATLSDYRLALDALIETVDENKEKPL